ncbi:MAG: UDP-N-acetylglucosamine 2-epimerase (non-hydrolyzing) [bacterium]|nr:UDP-N-acetylglucosamine 2-epimerase (non-hydrolyzing) [bacterium]
MKILHVVGARPNFMKMAPVFNALKKYKVKQVTVHTGQHYSANMSDIFFDELKIKKPDINLHVGSGTQAGQVADVMKAFEPVVLKEMPDMVLVYGDVNSTVAASMVCAKLGVKVVHVEAGLRSRDLSMPEEINRIITDRISSLYFTPSKDGDRNLMAEGVEKHKIHFVGNVMIDTLVNFLPRIRSSKTKIPFKKFGVVTLHRPSNVDDPKMLAKILKSLNSISERLLLVFPVHPRTHKMLKNTKSLKFDSKKIMLVDPLGYIEFLSLVYRSTLVITDSGGIQEETTYLGIPCFTMRPNTERPVTITMGTNTLVGNNFKLLNKKIGEVLKGKYKKGKVPPRWDGRAAQRIAKIIMKT